MLRCLFLSLIFTRRHMIGFTLFTRMLFRYATHIARAIAPAFVVYAAIIDIAGAARCYEFMQMAMLLMARYARRDGYFNARYAPRMRC